MHSATARLLLKKLNSGINTFQASELERDADDSSLIPRKEIMALLYDGIIREEGAAYRILIDIAALREEVLRQEQGKHEAKEKERSVCTIDDIIHSEWRLKEDGGETEKTSAHEGEDLEQKEGDLFDIKEAIEQKYQEFLRRRRASLEQMSQDDDDDFEGDDEPGEEDDELFDEESRAYREMLERADDDEFGEADEEDDEEIEVEFEDEDDEDEERRSREYRAKRSRELFEALRKLNDSTDGPDEQSPSLAQEYTSKDVDDFLEKWKAEEARRGREEWEEHRRLLEGLTHGGREGAEQAPEEVSEGEPETAGGGPSDELKDYERQRDLLEMAIGLIESEDLQDKLRAELLKFCAKKGSISISSYLNVRPNAEPQLVKRQLSALYEGGLLKRLPEPDIYESVLPKEVFEACFELVACAKKARKMASKPLPGSRASLEGVEQRENRPSCLDIIRRADVLLSGLLRTGKIKTRKKLMKMVDGAVFACRNLGNLLEAAAYREIWLELDEMSDGSFKAMVKHYRRAD